jgi:hypothetical protein
MKNAAGLLAFLSLMGAMGWYIPLILKHRVSPAPATWIVGTIAMDISLMAYHAIPGRTVIENATLYAAAFEITIVTIVLLVVLHRSGQLMVAFDGLQKTILGIMAATLVYWLFHRDQPSVTFWTTQTLLVVAYVATIGKAIQRRSAFDSIGNWGLILFASIVGTIPAVMMHSPYGLANSIRAVGSSGITVLILIYFDQRAGHPRWNDEKETLAKVYGIA